MKLCNRKALVLLFMVFGVVCGYRHSASESCGQRRVLSGTIFGGSSTRRGQWPWLVAFVYRFEEKFFCGGSLISPKHVLSGKNVKAQNKAFFNLHG